MRRHWIKLSVIFIGFTVVMTVALPARSLTIENKSPHTAHVKLTDDRFKVLDKFTIPAGTVHEYVDEEREKSLFNIEAVFDDPSDPTGIPTFFHQVKYKDKICMPLSLCDVKKKKKGGLFKIF